MVPFPKQRFAKMTDNNLDLKSGYINNKEFIVSNVITWNDIGHSIIISLWLKAQIAPPYYSNGLVPSNVINCNRKYYYIIAYYVYLYLTWPDLYRAIKPIGQQQKENAIHDNIL